jgi:hypothetical protein
VGGGPGRAAGVLTRDGAPALVVLDLDSYREAELAARRQGVVTAPEVARDDPGAPADHSGCLPGFCVYPDRDPRATARAGGPTSPPASATASTTARTPEAIAQALDVPLSEVLDLVDEDD